MCPSRRTCVTRNILPYRPNWKFCLFTTAVSSRLKAIRYSPLIDLVSNTAYENIAILSKSSLKRSIQLKLCVRSWLHHYDVVIVILLRQTYNIEFFFCDTPPSPWLPMSTYFHEHFDFGLIIHHAFTPNVSYYLSPVIMYRYPISRISCTFKLYIIYLYLNSCPILRIQKKLSVDVCYYTL